MKFLFFLIATVIGIGSRYQENILELPVKTVTVGEHITLYCNFSSNEIVIWHINGTKYNRSTLPDEYYPSLDNDLHILVIPVVKLWMNNTAFTCYGQKHKTIKPVGKLNVTFDFNGPNFVMKTSPNTEAFIPCRSSLEILNTSFSTWSINKTTYTPYTLPKFFRWTPNGLIINSKVYMNGITLQCLILSDVLLGDNYYYSSVGMLLVKGSQYRKHDNRSQNTIKFRHSNITFDKDYITISTADCGNMPFTYFLIKILNDSSEAIVGKYTDQHVTLSKDEIYNGNYLNVLYVKAVTEDNVTCDVSEVSIKLKYDIETTMVLTKPHESQCFSYSPEESVIWPYSPSSTQDCISPIIFNITESFCYNSTIYKISLTEGKVCWNELISSMNNTKIFFICEFWNNINVGNSPAVTREYQQAYEIIFEDQPRPGGNMAIITFAFFLSSAVFGMLLLAIICLLSCYIVKLKRLSLLYTLIFVLLAICGIVIFLVGDLTEFDVSIIRWIFSPSIYVMMAFMLVAIVVLWKVTHRKRYIDEREPLHSGDGNHCTYGTSQGTEGIQQSIQDYKEEEMLQEHDRHCTNEATDQITDKAAIKENESGASMELQQLISHVGIDSRKLEESVDNDKLGRIATVLDEQWEVVCKELVPANEIDHIKEQYVFEHEKKYQTLMKWKKRNFSVTYRELLEVILSKNMKNIAVCVCKVLKNK